MKLRALVVCTVIAGCQVESPDDIDDVVDLEAIAKQDKVTICHKPAGANPQTLEVAGPAVNAHLGHGDYLGACQPVICAPGSTTTCYDGPSGTAGVGTCVAGTQTCNANGTGYGACVGAVTPASEACGDGLDNDCDGTPDDSCVCAPGSSASCYTGPAGSEGLGTCAPGSQTCNATGTGYEACIGSVEPVAEVCGDGLDNDCDGTSDDNCVCAPGSNASCYAGPAGTEGVGTCTAGTQACNSTGTAYDACIGSVEPVAELCGDSLDNDCDGTVDDGCCVPSPEVCGDSLDNDCDGSTDEDCVCAPGSTVGCYDGPPGTQGIGECSAGTQTCTDGTGYGACVGSVTPTSEVCGDGLDNDCDGAVDDGCAPVCVPAPEVCGDNLDNDCDGQTDEGCLGDRAWNDRNRNGIQDAGEVGLGGATYILRTATGAVVAVTVSAANGTYWFSGIPAGDYYIEAIPPFSYTLSTADAGADDTVDNDFDGETGATTIFHYSGAATGIWDSGFYFVIQS